MTQDEAEIVAKLKEIEDQARLLLAEMSSLASLQRTRVVHIQGLATYMRSLIGNKLTIVRKSAEEK